MRQEQRQRHVLADDGGGLEQPLGLGRQPVDARGQDGLDGGGIVSCSTGRVSR